MLRAAIAVLLLSPLVAAQDGDWPQFRGPNGLAVASDTPIATDFGPDAKVLWKAKLPAGHSSPCIVGSRVFLTGFEDGKDVVVAIDRDDGKVVWSAKFDGPAYPEYAHPHAVPAVGTCVSDGERVIATFGNYGAVALDVEAGKTLWEKRLAHPRFVFGVGTSPLLYDGIVALSRDGTPEAALLVLDAGDGSELFRIDRLE